MLVGGLHRSAAMAWAQTAAAGGGAAEPHPTPAAEFEVLDKTREGRAAASAWVAGDERIEAAAVCCADGRVQPELCFGFLTGRQTGAGGGAAVGPEMRRAGPAPGGRTVRRLSLQADRAQGAGPQGGSAGVPEGRAAVERAQFDPEPVPDADNALARERMMERGDD